MPPQRVDHPLHDRFLRVLERVCGQTASIDTYGRPVAPTGAAGVIGANAYLYVMNDRPEVEFAVYPADTLTQAKAFYRRHNALAGVRTLRSRSNWVIEPNFHFGSFQRGYCWTCNERPLDEYVELWVRRIGSEAAVPRVDWDRYWSWLDEQRIACARDRPEFDEVFVMSNRPVAVPRPGLKLAGRWPLADVSAVSSGDDLSRGVRAALNEALAAFGAPTSDAA